MEERFSQLLERRIVSRLSERFQNVKFDDKTLHEMHAVIHEQITSVFQRSTQSLSPTTIRWLSNQFFKNLQLGTSDGMQRVDDLVVFNDHHLDELPFTDVVLMSELFDQTILGPELKAEAGRRAHEQP